MFGNSLLNGRVIKLLINEAILFVEIKWTFKSKDFSGFIDFSTYSLQKLLEYSQITIQSIQFNFSYSSQNHSLFFTYIHSCTILKTHY